MADFDDRAEQRGSDGAAVRPEAVATKVNWVPTLVMLGLFFWWLILAFFSYGRFPDLRDAARAIAYILFAGLVIAAAPALVRQIAPKASPAARLMGTLVIYLVVAVPLAYGLFWSSYDALNPIQARVNGKLPDVGSLIGRNQHDVARLLGAERVVGQAILPPSDASGPSRPGGADAQRFVVYSLPDLNSISWRRDKQASRQAESKQVVLQMDGVTTPAQWDSDAVVIVYYNPDSKVVGVRTDVSVRSAAAVLSNVTSETVLAAMGVNPKASVTGANGKPTDALSEGEPVADTYWGSGSANDTAVGYELQIGGIANFLTDRQQVSGIPGSPGTDQGDVTLVVAPNLTDTTSMLVATTVDPNAPQPQASDDQAGTDGQLVSHGASSFSDRTFWVVICSKPFSSEDDAIAQAEELNTQRGKNPPCFTVERSGHLAGLGTSDFWIVIYDVGYVYEDAARKAISDNVWGFPLSGVTTVEITKQCGDFTIAKVVE